MQGLMNARQCSATELYPQTIEPPSVFKCSLVCVCLCMSVYYARRGGQSTTYSSLLSPRVSCGLNLDCWAQQQETVLTAHFPGPKVYFKCSWNICFSEKVSKEPSVSVLTLFDKWLCKNNKNNKKRNKQIQLSKTSVI